MIVPVKTIWHLLRVEKEMGRNLGNQGRTQLKFNEVKRKKYEEFVYTLACKKRISVYTVQQSYVRTYRTCA